VETENHLEKDSDQAIQTQINETSTLTDRPRTSMISMRKTPVKPSRDFDQMLSQT
jgi:hypothetical protein